MYNNTIYKDPIFMINKPVLKSHASHKSFTGFSLSKSKSIISGYKSSVGTMSNVAISIRESLMIRAFAG